MKLNRIFTLVALGTAMFLTVSCGEDFSYTPAESPTGAQVYFPGEAPNEYTITEDGSSFSIPLNRANVEGALTVPLEVSGTEGTIYTVPNSVSFAAGEGAASIVVNYDASKLEYGRYDTLTIAINDVSLTTPYGVSTLTVVAGATAWVDFGVAQYREDLMTTFYGVGNDIYEVPIQKNIVKEGYYRLVNPYGEPYPYNEDGDYNPDVDSYLVINATDPDWVYVEDCETTMDWGYGPISMYGYAYYYLLNGNSLDAVKAAKPELFGTLKDGIITMPAGSMLISMADYNDGGLYIANSSGLFGVALPGAAFSDFSIEVAYSGIYTDATDNVFAVGSLTLGADVKTAKAVVAKASDDVADVAAAIAAGELEATDVATGRIEVPVAEGLTGKLQLVAVVLDGNEVKGVSSASFEYYGGGASPWTYVGTGAFIDDIVVSAFGYDPEPYYVEIEESTETPGLYRLVNMFADVVADFGEEGGYESIEVHAEDPEGVYIPQQRLGWDAGYGDMSFVSEGGRYVAAYDFETIKTQRPDLLGTLENGVITFPVITATNGTEYQGLLYMGSSGYYAGTNGAFEIYLPSALESASVKAKVQSRARAASFAKRLNAHKISSNKQRIISKEILKTPKSKPLFVK